MMNSKGQAIVCAICGSIDTSLCDYQPEDFEYGVKLSREIRVYGCAGCGSQFLWPRPTVEELISFYPLDYHAYNEDHGPMVKRLVALRARARARQLQRLAGRRPVRLFDVGTGDCRHFDDMAKHGEFECTGIELKPEMVDKARQNGYQVEQGTLEELDITPYEGRFDIVTMYQLVEHVLDPLTLFQKGFALLRPGGSMLGQVPRMDSFEQKIFKRYWIGYHYPRHLQAFTRRGMSDLLHQAGFSRVRVRSVLHLQSALSVQNLLVGGLGFRPRMEYGKCSFYSLLLLSAIPFSLLEFASARAGIMSFEAVK